MLEKKMSNYFEWILSKIVRSAGRDEETQYRLNMN